MENIDKYILKTREERRGHLNLEEPCVLIGGGSVKFQGLLAHFLGTTIPSNRGIMICHACNDSHCSNVKHLYWGTYKDNIIDAQGAGTHQNFHERVLRKYGKEKTKDILKRAASLGGKANRNKKKSEETKEKIRRTLLSR